MPLTYDRAALARLTSTLRGITTKGSPQRKAIVAAAAAAVKSLTREQLRQGIGPDGAPQRETKKGEPALKSAKLARGAVAVEVAGDTVHGYMKNSKWSAKLEAHQDGHTFPARSGVQRRNGRGRLISKGAFEKRVAGAASAAWTNNSGSYGYARLTKAGAMGRNRASVQRTKGGRRVLPPSPIYPVGGSVLTRRWESGIGDEVSRRLVKTLSKVKK